jgi:hypothetical protein
MASNNMGIGGTDTCRRWNRATKVAKPEVVKQYNAHMGEVDTLDFLVSIYRTFIRSRKWTYDYLRTP